MSNKRNAPFRWKVAVLVMCDKQGLDVAGDKQGSQGRPINKTRPTNHPHTSLSNSPKTISKNIHHSLLESPSAHPSTKHQIHHIPHIDHLSPSPQSKSTTFACSGQRCRPQLKPHYPAFQETRLARLVSQKFLHSDRYLRYLLLRAWNGPFHDWDYQYISTRAFWASRFLRSCWLSSMNVVCTMCMCRAILLL